MAGKPKTELFGVCHLHSETGTEGGHWAFQDKKFISADGKRWSYEGLHILKNGDRLIIYDPKYPRKMRKILWSGIINLKYYPLFTESASNQWIHSDQIGVPRKKWARWFLKEYPATLIPAPKKKIP